LSWCDKTRKDGKWKENDRARKVEGRNIKLISPSVASRQQKTGSDKVKEVDENGEKGEEIFRF